MFCVLPFMAINQLKAGAFILYFYWAEQYSRLALYSIYVTDVGAK